MKKLILCQYVVLMSVCLCTSALQAQNTAITDSDSYNAHSSAVLDVYSTTKGMLLPRLTTDEMNAITTPAAGLMVFNSDSDKYYFYTGTSWLPVSGAEYFQTKGDTVFITGHGMRMGVGDTSPMSRLSVKGDPTATSDAPLFEVKNSAGDIIFAVYENEVKVNFKESAKGVKGGFAVGGLSGTKADPVDYMRITPDSVRIYIDDSGTKGVKGGFAVGGLSGTKAEGNKYFMINDDSARIYIKDPAKGVKGGFAVGGLSGTKASKQNYFTIERDSARIYLGDPAKGVKGGFAVGGLSGTKSGANYLDLTPENYFIGHNAGMNTTGINNSFIGFEAGYSNLGGNNNVFVGKESGHSNTSGYNNLFIGNESGYSNTIGYENCFLGLNSGHSNVDGRYNLFFGSSAGESNIDGFENVYVGFNAGQNSTSSSNVMVGSWAGRDNVTGSFNTFLGMHAGYRSTGTTNTYVGYSAGGNGNYNVAIGGTAGSLSNGNYNVFMGHQCAINDTGSSNVMIGYRAGYQLENGSKNVFLGHKAGYSETESDKLYIDNSSTTTPLIYGDFFTDDLVFNGDVNITGTLTGGKSVGYKTDIFENTYELKPIGNYIAEIKILKHLPALQSPEDISQNGYNYSQQLEGLVEELQKAYLYIEEINHDIEDLKMENHQLKSLIKRIENIEKTLEK